MLYLCVTCWLKVPVSKSDCKASADKEFGAFSCQPAGIESSSDDRSSPPPSSQVSSCTVSRRTSIGPHFHSAVDDGGHVSMSESHENSIVRTKQQCDAEILNFNYLKMQLDRLTGQNREKQRQSDGENGNSTISPSHSCTSFTSQPATANLPYVGSWPSGLDRTPSIESDLLLPADSGISSLRSASLFATDNTVALPCKYTGVEQKLLLSDPICAATSVTSIMQGDSLAFGVGGQQVRHESSISNHHHYQHHHHHSCHHQDVAGCHDPLTQPSAVSAWPTAACPQVVSAGSTLNAFQQPGFLCDLVRPAPAYSTEWHQQLLQQQMQQQSLVIAQQMQAQHSVMTQYQQMLCLQQQLQQYRQAVQFMPSALLQSQYKSDMMQNTFVGAVPTATGLTPQYLQWQTQLTDLLIESGLSPGKAFEVVQQLLQIMMPASLCPVQVPGSPSLPLVTNSACSIDSFSHVCNQFLLSQFCAGGLPWSFLTSWSNVQVAYAQVVQLLARPNPLITPELLESMLAQLPPPLNLNASNLLNPGVAVESFCAKFLELLLTQISHRPVTPGQVTSPVSMCGFFGTSTNSNDDNSSVGLATVQSMLPGVEDKSGPVIVDSKQLTTPVKGLTCCAGVDGSNTIVGTHCPLSRGPSVDSESGDVPGAKVPGVSRSGMSCPRHHSLTTGNGVKVIGSSVPKKNVDCPQGLADLDMALKEKLRPRTTKGISQSVPEPTKTLTAIVVSTNVVSSIPSVPSQSAAAPVSCDSERSCITHVSASNGGCVTAARNASSVMHDASAAPKLPSVSVTKCAAVVINEKTDAVKKHQVPIARESACKDGDTIAADTAAVSCLRTVSAVPPNVPLPEVSKYVVKPANKNVCMSVAAGSVQSVIAAKPNSSQFRECASDHCLPSAVVSLPLLLVPSSDINRQHASDSAIASTATQLAQKHLQKKTAATNQDSVSAIDVTTQQPHPAIAVSYASTVFNVFCLCVCLQ